MAERRRRILTFTLAFNSRPLHEATRRALCRWTFLFCAALPVLLTLAACLAEYVPAYQRARAAWHERQLSALLGCDVEVAAVELRAPNRRLVHGVKFLHPETGETIARLQTLDIYESSAGYALRLINPELVYDHLASVYRLLHEHVLCRPSGRPQVSVAWIDGLSIAGGRGGRVHFRKVQLEMRRLPDQTQATLAFAIDGLAGQPATLAFSRVHNVAVPTSHLKLATAGQRIPAQWVAQFAPQFALPGDAAVITGQFALTYTLDHWSLEGSGRLLDTDTAAWMQPPLLDGLANVDVAALALSDLGLDRLHGRLSIGRGRIHDDLIKAADYVGIKPAANIASSASSPHPFEQLALEFALDSTGLQLGAGLASGAIVADQLGPLAEQTYFGNVPLRNLVAALVQATHPETATNLLESPTVRHLVQWLPRPVAAVTASAAQSSYQANTASDGSIVR